MRLLGSHDPRIDEIAAPVLQPRIRAVLLTLAALAAGAALAAQGPILTRLAAHAGGPLQAAAVAFAIGLLALIALTLAIGQAPPRLTAVLRMPRWLWASGFIGTALLVLTLYAVPRIGVAPFTAAVLCGQILAALAYDHFGALGLPTRAVALPEIAGCALVLAGLGIVLWGRDA